MKNDNSLKKIQDKSIITALLATSKENGLDVLIWKLLGSKKLLGQVRIESIRKGRNDFCISPIEGQEDAVKDLIEGQSYIDLYIPDSVMVLRCNVKHVDSIQRYYLEIPEFVAQVDRRKSLRLNVYGLAETAISFKKSIKNKMNLQQQFLKECYDISNDGFSFFISKIESKFFILDEPISGVEFRAGNWKTKLDAKIVSVREVEPDSFNGLTYKVWRVSCKFSNLDQISRKYLDKFIFERIKEDLHVINK